MLLIATFALAVGSSIAVGYLAGRFGPLPVATFVAVVFLLLVFGAGRGMRRFTRPMDDLIDAAGRIEGGDYSATIPESGPRELRSVARAFNSMSARLKSSDEQRRSFLADVVHELRTPLSVIRGQAEGIADGVYAADAVHIAPIVDATRSLEVLVEDLRALALTDTGSLALNREPVDPAELVDETVATFAAQADEAGVKLVASAPSGLPVVDVDPTRMRSAIGNVIANAIRHTPSGGSVSVSAVAAAEGDRVVISVTDTGARPAASCVRAIRARRGVDWQRSWPCDRARHHCRARRDDRCGQHRRHRHDVANVAAHRKHVARQEANPDRVAALIRK